MKSVTRILAVTLPLLVALAGCGRRHPQADAVVAMPSSTEVVVRGRIDIEGGEVSLTTLIDGVIAGVAVHEGEHVAKGQVLVMIDATAARIDEELAQAHLSGAQSRIRLGQARVAAAKTRAARLMTAAKMDAGDGQSADDSREVLAQAVGELDSAQSGVRTARAELERARYVLSQHVLHAPADGQVLRVTAEPGLHVAAQGASLLTLLPDKARIIRAELSEDAISDIAIGQSARVLSDDGRQTPLGTAHVLRIAPVYGPSTLQEDPQQRINERSVECVLALDGPTLLRVGRRVLVRLAATATKASPVTP
ncbi:HlyD family efflux transporter periplasmic adaptor subunit [Thermomonas sp.]|uniref:HlyD family secretion protein n=1 Tax=Thermomonas sp. TaxID=1971895 RepID=UPI0024890D86|nr:HlyD family efflux transporter periplasmic adaptor subunit [Thermomonas sp.]MDI1252829.1 HlyD family efflux transporter periplasmic adaptor subunit [Thermomonas sp.]